MDLPRRKPTRSRNIDYSRTGAYFLTLCIQDRHRILSEISAEGNIILSEYGRIVENQIQNSNRIYDHINVKTYCIMPDHVHMIVLLQQSSKTEITGSIPSFVSSFKRFTNKAIGFPVWQRSYYDTFLPSEKEYNAAARYIDENPKRWLIKYNTPIL